MSDDTTLAEDCAAMGMATRDDGWIEGEIVAITKTDTAIELVVRHPTGERLTWDLDKPETWDETNLFVRLVESIGYGAGAVELLEGETLLIAPRSAHNNEQAGFTLGHPSTDEQTDQSGKWVVYDPRQDRQEKQDLELWAMFSPIGRIVAEIGRKCVYPLAPFIVTGIFFGVVAFGGLHLLPNAPQDTEALDPFFLLTDGLFLTSCLMAWITTSIRFILPPEFR